MADIEKHIKFTVLPEINYAFQKTVSFSQYSTYNKCEYQWYLQYVKRLASAKATINTIFGDAFHRTLQHYLTLLYNESVSKADEINLVEYFNERFREEYKKEFDKTQTHFSSADEMSDFFEDAIAILEYFKKHRKIYFLTKKVKLLGVEMPLKVELKNNLYLKGYVDVVLYDEDEDIVTIYDVKTSGWGWGSKNKKDEIKIAQVLLYKEYFAKQYNIDIDKIEVQFFIVRRKIYKSEYEIPRIQIFKPASGKIKRKKTMNSFNKFIDECFGADGKELEREYKKEPSKSNCQWCVFRNKKDLCDVGI